MHAYASYGGFREGYTSANVFETTSAGTTSWKNVSGNLPNARVNFLAYDRANDTLYAAADLGVYYMQNDDKVWTQLGSNLPNTATEDLKIQASSGRIYVATFGRGTWRIPLVPGTPRYNAQVVTDLDALSATITGLNKEVLAGGSPCNDLDALKAQIASFVPKKITTAQQAQLNSAIDAIKAENPC